MKRIAILVAALGVFAGACGSDDGDDGAATTEAPAAADESTEESADESAEESADESADAAEPGATEADVASDDDQNDDQNDGDQNDDQMANEDDDSGTPIRSIDDIPPICRELMGDFLRDIEPSVESIDWASASLEDVESIGQDFEARSAEFEAAGEADGCNDLDFVGDSEFELMVEFAEEEAPGTVEFLQFISDVGTAVQTIEEPTDAGGFESCDDAVAFVQDMVDTYDSVNQVPASDLLKFQGLAAVMMSCTPEQLQFFDDSEISDFFGG